MLSDREQIHDLAVRYATALDNRNWELLRTCFLPDATGHYEGIGEVASYEEIERICRRALEPLDASQHILSNFVIDIHGDEADFTCYLHAQHVKTDAPGGPNFVIAGTYRDRHVKTSEGWRIARRELSTAWSEGNLQVIAHALEPASA
jgi:3-phenylpropionate/cinnamic acid dioxygenase small subunit